MAKDKLLPLKIIVYAMGVMLLGGFLWLGGKLAVKASDMNNQSCQQTALNIPQGANLFKVSFAHDNWIAEFSYKGQMQHWRFNRCGTLKQKVVVVPGLIEIEEEAALVDVTPSNDKANQAN